MENYCECAEDEGFKPSDCNRYFEDLDTYCKKSTMNTINPTWFFSNYSS